MNARLVLLVKPYTSFAFSVVQIDQWGNRIEVGPDRSTVEEALSDAANFFHQPIAIELVDPTR